MSVQEDMYNRAIELNKKAFSIQQFDAAYHFLAGALHCARQLESDEPLTNVKTLATDEIAWIDEHAPGYEHSTQSVKTRHQSKGIYQHLADQAEAALKMRDRRRRQDQLYKSI